MKKDYVIETKELSAAYSSKPILRDITLTIPRGSVTCICGGSGCGKSTFLRACLGMVPKISGKALILGENLRELEDEKRAAFMARLGFMYQNGGLLNSLSIYDNLRIPYIAHTHLPPKVIDEMIYHKLAQVHLSHALHLLPGELSGGMLKRAGFARAIALEPELVLSDEPSAGLDPTTAADLDDLMVSLKNELGMSLVVVTHDLDSIKRIADRVVMLDEGYVLFDGTLEEALKSTIPFVRMFFARESSNTKSQQSSLHAQLKENAYDSQ